MLNYTDIKGSLVKQAQSLPVPMISIPTEWTESINWIREVLTSDRAKMNYARAWTATKWTARAAWTVVLVLIGLVMLAIDAWQNREEVKKTVLLFQELTVGHIRQGIENAKTITFHLFWFIRNEGVFAVDSKVIAPAITLRDRAKSAAQLMIQGKEI